MKGRKPIFIVEIEDRGSLEETSRLRELQIQALMPLEEDYHVLVVIVSGREAGFKMFSDREIEPIELERPKVVLKHERSKSIKAIFEDE